MKRTKRVGLSFLAFLLFMAKTAGTQLQWLPADIRLNTDVAGAYYSFSPQVCCSGDNVYVVWSDARNGEGDIYFNYSTNGGVSWQVSDIRIENDPGVNDSYAPQICCAGSSVYVVWSDERNGRADIYFNYSTDGGTNWQASDIRLDTGDIAGASYSFLAQICCEENNVYGVWYDFRNFYADIYFNYSTDGGANWQASDIRLDTGDIPGAHSSFDPDICCSGDNVYVVWRDDRNEMLGQIDIYFNSSIDGGATWQVSDTRIDHHAGDISINPHICCAESNIYVSWEDMRNGPVKDIYFNYSTDGGASWQGSDIRLDTGDLPGAHDSMDSQICCSGNSVCAIWTDKRDGGWDIYFNSSIDGGATWPLSDTHIDNIGTNSSFFPQIWCSGSTVYAVWEDKRKVRTNIYFNSSNNGGTTWQRWPTRLDNGKTGWSVRSQISCAGTVPYVVWEDTRNGLSDIYFNTASKTTPSNLIPVAVITGDLTACPLPKEVRLSGDGSYDEDGRVLEYLWEMIKKPAGSNAELSSTTTVTTSFVADEAGIYIVSLKVEGVKRTWSETVTATVTAKEGDPPALSITGERKEERAWIIRKDYAELSFMVIPPSGCQRPISKYIILKREGTGSFSFLKDLNPSEFIREDGVLKYNLTDKYLEKNITVTYQFSAIDNRGKEASVVEKTLIGEGN